MKTTLSMQCGAPYIPIPKGRGFTANPDNHKMLINQGFCENFSVTGKTTADVAVCRKK